LIEPVEFEFTVDCSVEHAWHTWATKTSSWWPRDHTRSSEEAVTITFEPRPGGRIYERTSKGVEHDWGEVLLWDPPHKLAYLWHLSGDRSQATTVTVSFSARGAATWVSIVQTGWDRLGAKGPELRRRNFAGWSGLRPLYAAACSE
jgi:uncharacterized protein YndB with AHSA1/START domain